MSRKGQQTKEKILTTARDLVMQKGFAGTSIDDILKGGPYSKGQFFHHFGSKADLATELVKWHAGRDIEMFRTTLAQAETRSDDPLAQMMLFLKMFERYISNENEPSLGCMYAVYTYESMQFDPSIRDFVADTLRDWTAIYVRKFQEILECYEPARPVTARQLAEMIVSIIEGALVLQRAYGNVTMTARQSAHFRDYLELLFGTDGKAKSGAQKRLGAAA